MKNDEKLNGEHIHRLFVKCVSFCSLIKGITLEIHMLCPDKQRSFEHFYVFYTSSHSCFRFLQVPSLKPEVQFNKTLNDLSTAMHSAILISVFPDNLTSFFSSSLQR